jgi:hypothetical protein
MLWKEGSKGQLHQHQPLQSQQSQSQPAMMSILEDETKKQDPPNKILMDGVSVGMR